MKKYLYLLLLGLSLLNICTAQTKTDQQKVYNKEFKWTIQIPVGFDTVSAEEKTQIQNRGKEVIENSIEGTVENNATTIFIFKKDQYNYFESNYQAFDSTKDGDHLESFKGVNDILYGTFEAQIKGAKFDSSYSTTTISGLDFLTYHLVITFPNKRRLNLYMYSRLFGNRELTVNIMTIEKQREKELLEAWLNSKFEH